MSSSLIKTKAAGLLRVILRSLATTGRMALRNRPFPKEICTPFADDKRALRADYDRVLKDLRSAIDKVDPKTRK